MLNKFEYSNFKKYSTLFFLSSDHLKFDFQIPAGLNSAKSVLCLH